MDADNRAWAPPECGAVRALSVALKPMGQGRAWKHDKDLADRLTDQGVGLLGRAGLTVIGLQNASKLPNCGQLGAVRLRRDYAGIRGARGRVMAWLAAGMALSRLVVPEAKDEQA